MCREKLWGYRSFVQSTYNCYVPIMCKPWAYNGAYSCLEDAGRGLMHLGHANRHRVTPHRVTLSIIGDTDTMKQSGQFLNPVCPLWPVDTVTGKPRWPRLSNRPQMPYMEAFLLETFRHSSFVPFTIPHK